MATPRMMPVILLLLLSLAIRCADGKAVQGDSDPSASLLTGDKNHDLPVKRDCTTCAGEECCGRCTCPWGDNCSCIEWGK
nr:TPA_inf: conotoxin precursor V [Conus ebraeus]